MPSLTLKPTHDSDSAKNMLKEVENRVKLSERHLSNYHDKWRKAEDKTLAYLPEREIDARRRVLRDDGGLPQYTTIQIPYSYAVLMASHTYWTSVFLGRNPVFQYDGRHGESQQQVQALEAIVNYQLMVGEMLGPLYGWLYDAGRYGIGIVGLHWEERFEHISQVVKEQELLGSSSISSGREVRRFITQRVRTYSGNRLYNIQPWDFLFDPRVPAGKFQEGEYCSIRREMGWNHVKRLEAQGYLFNIENVMFGDNVATDSINVGSNSPTHDRPDTNLEALEGNNKPKRHPAIVKLHQCYVEIIPKEWRLSNSDFPEKWVFTCTQDFKTLIGAQPLGAYHAKFPFSVLEMEPESYAVVNRGIPEILEPVQQTVDWLINSHFYNVRATLNNQYVVDPSKIVMKDAMDPLPGGLIRLRESAYGTDVKLAMQQLPVVDATQNHFRDIQQVFGIGERAMGVNDQIMGLLATGGRKTATEVRTSSSFGVNRLKTISEYFSATGFQRLSQMIVQHTQQYMDVPRTVRIAGNLLEEAGAARFVSVTPEDIGGFFDFVSVDGTLPIDRFAQANLWRELFAQLRNFPEIMVQYDIGRIFAWVAQLAGLKNIDQFRVQVAPDQQLALQAQAGNIVPMGGRGGRPNGRAPQSDTSRVPAPQTNLVGPVA